MSAVSDRPSSDRADQAPVEVEVTVTHDDDGPKPVWPKSVILEMREDGSVTWRWPGGI